MQKKEGTINSVKRQDYTWAYLMIAPTIIGLIILNIIPFIQTIYMSFTETAGFGNSHWTGIQNYATMVQDENVMRATINTIYFVVLSVPVGIILALVLATLLNTKIKGKDVYRGIYFLPIVVAPAAVSMVWKWLFNTEYGIINYTIQALGGQGIGWLSNPKVVLISVAIVAIWSSVGYDLILILAGLQSISHTYYEAASIDGASGFKQFLKITVPLVSPTLFFVLVMRLMSALKQFDLIYMMLNTGSPALKQSETLMNLFYKQAFTIGDKGYASAIVVWTVIVIGGFTMVQFLIQKYWVHYE